MSKASLWTFAQWRKWAVGKLIDIDGYYGAQCWDLFADYAIRVAGAVGYEPWTSGNAGQDTSLVSSIWLKFPARPGIEKRFRQVSRHETPREGDVAIWARSASFPWSHIGMCTGRVRPGQIEVISQNLQGSATSASGPASVDWLTTGGLLGYLRPGTSSNTPAARVEEPIIQEDEMTQVFARVDGKKDGEWMRTDPGIGTDLKPGQSRKDGPVTVFRGAEVTTTQSVGYAWGRTHARAYGNAPVRLDRNSYNEVQKQAARLSVELHG